MSVVVVSWPGVLKSNAIHMEYATEWRDCLDAIEKVWSQWFLCSLSEETVFPTLGATQGHVSSKLSSDSTPAQVLCRRTNGRGSQCGVNSLFSQRTKATM